ncbi:forkhead box protein N1 [Callorhinchus milii]|uniref:forkhead box protein N1 n=1 Tax=Callorhinchus milii TaxID=7868 RepID=UPI001C3FA656|nr:forkhead box protein N1 [Callorhinchus milii]
MAFSDHKYDLNQEDIIVNPQTDFLVDQPLQIHQVPVSANAMFQTNMNYMAGHMAGNSFLNQQQTNTEQVARESPLQLVHAIQDSKYQTDTLSGVGLEQPEQQKLLCYHSQPQPLYCPIQPIQQQYCDVAGYPGACAVVQFPYQRIAPHFTQEAQHHLYPKPIYSYSILIFMALKNSKTGSLPVSEIYNFMTEHFPYFKSAPDGWKNSVRHNLSLNKCFEKVENKCGGSSRKGCLWALNPAKVQKMQEELQKWKRKDPSAVRKSMAKPDELDRLIGEKNDKMRSSKMTSPPLNPRNPKSPHHPVGHPHTLGHPLPPNHPQPHSYGQVRRQVNIHRDCQQELCHPHPYIQAGVQANSAENSAVNPSQTPSIHSSSAINSQLLMEQAMIIETQDILMEADISTDIDALNPSLVDFELQGNLWEELKDDSLTPDHLVSTASSPQSPSFFPFYWNALESSDSTSSPSCPEPSLADLQLTSVYSTYTDLDSKPSSYLNSTGCTPIALM